MTKHKNMYRIKYEKTGSNSVGVVYNGGNDEDAVKQSFIEGAVTFHNRYYPNKLEKSDFRITECVYVGEYETVLKELERG